MKVINVKLHSKDDYINKYNDERLNQELIDYLMEEIKATSIKEKIKINIVTEFIMEQEEKNRFLDMIRSHFGTDIGELYNLNERVIIIDFLISIIGILALITYFFLMDIPLISEFLLIVGWVLLGEVICNILFEMSKTKLQIKKMKKLTTCKIEFN